MAGVKSPKPEPARSEEYERFEALTKALIAVPKEAITAEAKLYETEKKLGDAKLRRAKKPRRPAGASR